jgi:hypothetical protein
MNWRFPIAGAARVFAVWRAVTVSVTVRFAGAEQLALALSSRVVGPPGDGGGPFGKIANAALPWLWCSHYDEAIGSIIQLLPVGGAH